MKLNNTKLKYEIFVLVSHARSVFCHSASTELPVTVLNNY